MHVFLVLFLNVTVGLYFVIKGNSGKTELSKDSECNEMITRAEKCLTDLINSVEKGTVRVATLNLLDKHRNQFLKLGEIHQTNKKVETPSINVSFSQRLSELEAFLAFKDNLDCFIHFCNIFPSGK